MGPGPKDVYVALLRGINVGGRNRLPMKKLAATFVDAGCEDVRTYIQSGNVVFRAESELADRIPEDVAERIAEDVGLNVPVIVRSADELAAVVAGNPFLDEGVEERALHVMFLADEPDPSDVDDLDPDRSLPDKFAVHRREIYRYCPNGVARTKLTNAYFDARLGTISTSRNWRTVNKLLDMAGA